MPASRRVYVRRRIAVGLAVIAIVATGTYSPVTLLAPLDVPTSTEVPWVESSARAAQLLVTPAIGSSAIGAVGFDGLLAQSGSTGPVPIASISKIITALVVLEAQPLQADEEGPILTFDADDAALYGKYLKVQGTVEPMRPGLEMTEREALEVVLISSANNYAEAVAEWAFGSGPAFVAAASEWVASHGLVSTTIVEPTGMSPDNVSSAVDLVRLGELALEHPVVSSIVSSSSATVPFIGEIENTNELLGIGGVDGIKTGTLAEAGSCLLFSTDYVVGTTTVTVIGVVLGAVNRDAADAAVTALLADVPSGFHEVTLAVAGQEFGSLTTVWDDRARALATETTRVVVWSDDAISAEIELIEVIQAESGDPAGKVEFALDGRVIAVSLVFDGSISEPGPWWRVGRPLSQLGR